MLIFTKWSQEDLADEPEVGSAVRAERGPTPKDRMQNEDKR
jgi:hypothetical protein